MRAAKSIVKHKIPQQLELSASDSPVRVVNNSDDSDGLMTTKKTNLKQRAIASMQETVMRGALAVTDTGTPRSRTLAGRQRPGPTKIQRNPNQNKAVEALKARRDAALAAERGETFQIRIPLSYPDSIPTYKSPVRGQSSAKATEIPEKLTGMEKNVQATPQMGSNFKRRPRQPSLLRLIQAQANPQSEDEDDDLEDFHPDDESTPFIKQKSQAGLDVSPSSVASSPTSSSLKRKRASPNTQAEVQVPMSQPIEPSTVISPASSSLIPEPEPEELYNLPSSIPNSYPEPTLPLPRQQPRKTPPVIYSDSVAPSRSSSPLPPPSIKIAKPRNTRNKATSSPAAAPLSSSPAPPAPISSPPLPAPGPTATGARKPLLTASLQNLLPRRHRRSPLHLGDAFNVLSSSDVEIDTTAFAEDEDELSVHAKVRIRARNREKPAIDTAKKKTRRGVPTKKQPRGKDRLSTTGKTYSNPRRVAAIVSENFDADDTNPVPPSKAILASDELARLARKFREVDQWQLDIEDVTGSSSGQRDAR